jgi:hypothetical protein
MLQGPQAEMQRSREVRTQHMLEMRADSPYARQIETGMRLHWTSRPTLGEIEACMAENPATASIRPASPPQGGRSEAR